MMEGFTVPVVSAEIRRLNWTRIPSPSVVILRIVKLSLTRVHGMSHKQIQNDISKSVESFHIVLAHNVSFH